MDLRFSEVASLFEKEVNDFEVCLYQPCLINKWNGPDRMEHPIGSSIIDFRINNNGSLPTRMRSLFSWNVNSWRTFNSNEYKLRRCKRLLRKGPVCLQETKWTGGECNLSHARTRILSPIAGPQWINVPNEVAADLVKESRSAVIANLDVYQQVNGCYALPRMRVQEMLEVIDRCIEGIPYVPLDEANAQARGWERMRNICPKVNSYYGPVYGREGKQCVTSLDLDEAMLATRDFWFLAPTDYDNSWTPVLEVYE